MLIPKKPEDIAWAFFRFCNYLLLAVCLFVLPLLSIYIGYSLTTKTTKTTWNPLNLDVNLITSYIVWIYLGVGIVTLGSRIIYILARDKEEREFTEFRSEIYFITNYAHSAWSIGASVACILIGLFFLFPVKGDHFERYQGALGLYFAILAITLGIHALYRKEAPILNVSQFLDSAIKDLDRDKGNRLWIVFPALNIGYYRAYGKYDTRVTDFKNALSQCALRLRNKAKAITYHPKYYISLFRAYDEMVAGEDKINKQRISDCAENAYDFIRDFTDPTVIDPNSSVNRRGNFYGFPHDDLPPFVLVIGNIVYFMITYSLPYWDEENGKFSYFHSPEHKLVEMIVYRREDEVLARTVVRRLEDAIRGKNPLIVEKSLLHEPLPHPIRKDDATPQINVTLNQTLVSTELKEVIVEQGDKEVAVGQGEKTESIGGERKSPKTELPTKGK